MRRRGKLTFGNSCYTLHKPSILFHNPYYMYIPGLESAAEAREADFWEFILHVTYTIFHITCTYQGWRSAAEARASHAVSLVVSLLVSPLALLVALPLALLLASPLP
jgi:hypothetical protein